MLEEALKASLGLEKADLIIEDCKLVNVATGEIYEASIAIKGEVVVGVGDVKELEGNNTEVIEAHGLYAAPGFIDGHVHVESSHLTLTGFAEAVLPHGTTSAVIDPHEMANVLGVEGVQAMINEARQLLFKAYFMTPSCVPSAPGLETSGAELGLREVGHLLDHEEVLGLAEVMNYPGVLIRDRGVLGKIELAISKGKLVDGHCPGLRGRKLSAYIVAGPRSDHESLDGEEAVEKLRQGMWVMVREGSSSKNLEPILREILRQGLDLRRIMIVTDDVEPRDLIQGHLDVVLRKAVMLGLEPLEAIRMVTLNPSTYFALERQAGLVAPGWKADVVLIEDLEKVKVRYTIVNGVTVAADSKMQVKLGGYRYPESFHVTVKLPPLLDPHIFAVKAPISKGVAVVRVMVVKDGSLVTEASTTTLEVKEGLVKPDPYRDVLQAAVVERHGKSGRVGLGFVSGFSLKKGAIASSYAHDSHNIVVVGASWTDMALAVNKVVDMQGGYAVAVDGRVEAEVKLEVAGLMSYDAPLKVAEAFSRVQEALEHLGCRLTSPLQTLSFISLPVIPKLKLTDRGLVDVESFSLIDPLVSVEVN